MKPTRIVRREVPDATQWPGIHPVLCRVYAARGVCAAEEVDYRLARLQTPERFGGMEQAVDLLVETIRADAPIVVVGDFDADGATGTAVALRGLRALGARDVAFRVPHRMRHGYGLSAALVAEIAISAPALLITVDNGIASHAGVAAAHAAGMRVLVTDHHLPGATLPAADAIVNPNLPGDGFPSKALAGVGVMFYLLLATRARFRSIGWFDASRPEPDLGALLDLVAVGTVADLVPLDFNNRILVAAGLRRIRAGQACAGIRALLAVSGRDAAQIGAGDLGFAVAPRINAAGRIDDMSLGIECLVTDDYNTALATAGRLDAINAARRDIQADMVEQAESMVAGKLGQDANAMLPVGVCLYDDTWHPGIVGLVASRLKERLNRPVIALAPAGEGSDELRGSARSVPGFHIRDALAAIDARQPGLIDRFGGHAMAAGLSLARDKLEALRAEFDGEARRMLGASIGDAVIWSDGELRGIEVELDLAERLARGGPWGQAFPEPVFDNVFVVRECRVLRERHLKLTLAFETCGTAVQAIYFNAFTGQATPRRAHIAYQLGIDDWRDQRRVQLIVRHCEPL